MTKPLTPQEVSDATSTTMPEHVVQAFNDAILAQWNGQSATIKESAIAAKIAERLDISTDEVRRRGYLDVARIFQRAGWKVKRHTFGRNEWGDVSIEFLR